MSGKILHLAQQVTTLASERLAAPLVGREVEIAALHQRLEAAVRGQRQVVFLAGEPGIGKTALVDAFLTQLQKRTDVRTTSGQCVEQYGPGEAYLPLLEATTRLCRGPDNERRVEALKRYAPSLLAQLPGLLEPQAFEQLQQRVQGTSRERMLRETAEAVEGFTAQRGLVVVLEDLHWSDVSTLDWVSYMARRREPAKLLILGTYRPADVLANNHPLRGIVQELQARRQCEELRLTPLAEEAIGEYLSERFAGGVTDRSPLQGLTPVLYRRTGGHPLFIVNTVDDLIRQGALIEDGGQWRLRADTVEAIGEGVPDTLRQLIERQLERLPESERRLLEVASVIGVEFTAAEVTAGLQTNSEEIESQCEQLARTGQWAQAVGVAEWPDGTISGRYSFRHALYHEVVYAQSAEVRRVQLHRRIAERKVAAYGERAREIAAELAVHFERGRDLTRAVQYLGKAGETAARCSAHQEAIAHLTKGLDLLTTFPETPERAQQELQLRLALIESLIATKGYGALEVERACARARELCQQGGEPRQLLVALWGLSGFYLTRAELQTTHEVGEQLLHLAHNAHEPILLQTAHLILGQSFFHDGELTLAHAHLEQSTAFYDRRTPHSSIVQNRRDPGVVSLCYEAWNLCFLGYAEHARQRIDDAFSLAQEFARPFESALALSYATALHYFLREPQAAQEQAEAAIRLSTEQGFPFWAAMGTLLRGWALALQGQEEDGIVQMHQGLATWRAIGVVLGQPGFLAMLAEAQSRAGQVEEGLHTLAEAVALVAKTGERYYEAEVWRMKGELLLNDERGMQNDERKAKKEGQDSVFIHHSSLIIHRSEEAEACFHKAIEIAQSQQAKFLELRAVMSLARLWQQQNKVGEARELLEETYCWFTEGFDTKDLQAAEALLVTLGSNAARQKAKGKRQNAKVPDPRPLPPDFQSSVLSPQSLSSPDLRRQTRDESRLLTPEAGHQTPDAVFRPEGEYWTVSFAGTTCRLKDVRGLHYIAYLLQHPHKEFHVITLISEHRVPSGEVAGAYSVQDPQLSPDHSEGFSDAGEVLDPQARAAYKQRLSELREELAEAQEFHDLGRSERLTGEIDFLTQELARAVGLGGRARRMGSPAERARVNITRAIKIALRKIDERHAMLGQHLAATIKTGTYCSYAPDARMPITWQG